MTRAISAIDKIYAMAAKKKKASGIEWVGGLVSLPSYVTGEGEPFRPETLLWISAEGAVLGTRVAKPGELLGTACKHLQQTIASPMFGRPHAPARLRVASPELAETLRAGCPSIDIVRAPTPELDEIVAMLAEQLGEGDEAAPSYLSPELGPDAIASLFRAAAGLFRAQPWKHVPSDQSVLSVTIEKLALRDAVLSVIGQMGQSLGIVLFSGIEDFEAYLDAADAVQLGDALELPPHFALNFERRDDLPAALRQEIDEHQWVVAGADAFPWMMVLDEDMVARPPTPADVAIAEAVACALTAVLVEKEALCSAWSGGAPFSRTLPVHTSVGDLEVTLRAPYERRT